VVMVVTGVTRHGLAQGKMSLSKRPRRSSGSSSDGSTSSTLFISEHPPTKATRMSPEVDDDDESNPPLLCTLPPTCNPPHNRPTSLASTKDLESHYSNFHAHVCEERGCKCVFPEARLLELVSFIFNFHFDVLYDVMCL
jgi:hypothetical protein